MRDDTKKGQLTRRAVLAMTAAIPAAVVPVSAAHAQRRPPLGSAPSVTIGPQAQQVTTSAGVPGIQLTLLFSEPGEGVSWTIDELFIDRVRVVDINPGLLLVTGQETFHIVGSPVAASGPTNVVLRYTRASDAAVTLPPVIVTTLPAQAKPPKPRKPPKPPKPPKL